MSRAATASMRRILGSAAGSAAAHGSQSVAPAARPVASGRRRMLASMTDVPPVVVSVDLPVPPATAYAAFVARFADWWPGATHSLSRDAATRCRLDATPGGVVEERGPDGSCHRWGTVESVEPGRRLRFTWHPGREPESAQWVDVEFLASGAGTRVTLTHGGWDALGEIAPILRREYQGGWQHLLEAVYSEFVVRSN